MFSGVASLVLLYHIAEKVDGVGYKGSGETTMVDVQTLGGLFELIPEICQFN